MKKNFNRKSKISSLWYNVLIFNGSHVLIMKRNYITGAFFSDILDKIKSLLCNIRIGTAQTHFHRQILTFHIVRRSLVID